MSRPPRLRADRDPGDNWAVAPDGTRYWGAFGAAGLLAHDVERGILLQHRAEWSHHGGTWGIPGGARHQGEGPLSAALREASEEAGAPSGRLRPRALHVLDREVWTYTTVVAEVTEPFEPVAGDEESLELAWVALDEVAGRELHPGFAASWPVLREALAHRPALVVDAANVVGAVPDGWWRDRAGAAARLVGRLEELAQAGMDAGEWDLPLQRWFPRIVAVVEGRARGTAPGTGVEVVDAPGSGDDAIVAQTHALAAAGHAVTVATSDRGLRARVEPVAATRGAGWLIDALDAARQRG
ncbi:NUDIX domain-containing protein [Demequina sp. SYSU T00192]|uniref:NUDIX domain-containing protein n=1 Tax=Demequina litoralis TaxID=3051660 RepID=A0ABT8G5K0_9MICO|nr:NUDIX domain-containing protein [Demequina sp. SYSU T00192]MDN4474405.1 NUDIX domain-containing protein [Demequina sp. SYSU T00192]